MVLQLKGWSRWEINARNLNGVYTSNTIVRKRKRRVEHEKCKRQSKEKGARTNLRTRKKVGVEGLSKKPLQEVNGRLCLHEGKIERLCLPPSSI